MTNDPIIVPGIDLAPDPRQLADFSYRHAYAYAYNDPSLTDEECRAYAEWYATEYGTDENPPSHPAAMVVFGVKRD